AERGVCAAGQPAGGDRAAAARALGGRRRLLSAVDGRCAPEGAARAIRDRAEGREATLAATCAPARSRLRTAGRRSFPPRRRGPAGWASGARPPAAAS